MSAWWQNPIRAVTLEFPASDVSTINVRDIVNEAHAGGVNTLCVFAIGYYPGGTAFYQSKLAPHYEGLGSRDLLQETIDAAKPNGQKIIAYIASIWGNRSMLMDHPDWAQRKANGDVTSWDENFSSVAMCPNSPYRAHLASLVEEIQQNYPIDGFYFDEPAFQSWCACSYCQEKFYGEYHQPLPTTEDWGNPVFQQFIQWRYRQITEWRQSLYEAFKREDQCILFQGAFPLAVLPPHGAKVANTILPHGYQVRFGVTWHVLMAHGTDLAASTAYGDVLHFELYRRSVREPLWWYGVSLRYGQAIARQKRILVLSMMGQTPFDLYGMAEEELKLSIAELLANSGDPLFARYYPDRVDQVSWDKVYAELNAAASLDPYMVDRESIKYAALVYSPLSVERFDHVEGEHAHLSELKGFAKALLQSHILFDVIPEADLAQRLADYRVVILPNTTCLSAAAKEAIRAFAMQGGGIVTSFESGMFDPTGCRTPHDDLAELLGLEYGEETPSFQGFDVYMKILDNSSLPLEIPVGKQIPSGGMQVSVTPDGAHAVAGVMAGSGIMYGRLGDDIRMHAVLAYERAAGRSVYFAPAIGNTYLDFGVEDHRHLITSAVKWAAQSPAQIQLENAPRTLALTAFQQDAQRRMIIHLVNSVRDEVMQPIIDVPISQQVLMKIWLESAPRNVLSIAGDAFQEQSYSEGILTLRFEGIKYHAVVAVEF